MSNPRPISTAPQDGTHIWAFIPDVGRRVVYWDFDSEPSSKSWRLKDADRPVNPTVWYGPAGLSNDTPPMNPDLRGFRPASLR
jgi:hypothetical protein